MQIAIVTIGSRGDVQPCVALGCGLQAAGHAVAIVTHRAFEGFVRERGLAFRGISGDPRAIVSSDAGRAWMAAGQRPFFSTRRFAAFVCPLMPVVLQECWDACRDADLVVYSPFGWFFAQPLMEKLGIPGIPACVQPLVPTRAFPDPFFPPFHFGPWYNLLTFSVADHLVWHVFRSAMNRARKEVMDLPPLSRTPPIAAICRSGTPVLCAHSPSLLPPPPDWSDRIHVTGYWFLDRMPEWQPSRELTAFLDHGDPPVCVGFSNRWHTDAGGITHAVVEALRRLKRRGILVKGWGGIDERDLPASIIAIDQAPFDWLLPRCVAVVHHAGAGTTAAGLRAGIPTLTIPFLGDQPFWAAKAYAAGVGPRPLHFRKLTAEHLAHGLHIALTDRAIHARAAAMGEGVRAEDGVGRAVDIISSLMG